MKWIKAEDLMAARFHLEKDYPKITPPGVDPEVYMRGWNDALEAAADRAEERPAEDGRWIIRDNPGTGWWRATCSECGEDVTAEIRLIGFFPDVSPIWNYCPYCGARMDAPTIIEAEEDKPRNNKRDTFSK